MGSGESTQAVVDLAPEQIRSTNETATDDSRSPTESVTASPHLVEAGAEPAGTNVTLGVGIF